jgi:protein-tyrosine phosphatase
LKRVDFHAHVLPGVDHGCKDLATSLLQLQWAKKAGVDTIVATPHFYGWKQDLAEFTIIRQEAWNILQPEAEILGVQVVPSAEVTLYRELSELTTLEELTIPNTSYMLLEMPMEAWGNWVYTAIEKIISVHKILPIIVHVDRYSEKDVEKLLDWNLIYQINAEAFQSIWKRRKFIQWVQQERVHLIGSDVHGDDGKDYQVYDKALKHLSASEEILMLNARRILAGKQI